eukprot:scaffold90444_cov18-Prasinocladus_malaysianus.AAC.1
MDDMKIRNLRLRPSVCKTTSDRQHIMCLPAIPEVEPSFTFTKQTESEPPSQEEQSEPKSGVSAALETPASPVHQPEPETEIRDELESAAMETQASSLVMSSEDVFET